MIEINEILKMVCPAISIFLPPKWSTRWPTVNSAASEPKAPKLKTEPKSPLFTPKLAFTSGNLGTQPMIPRPNRKKSVFVKATSRLIKITHSLNLFALGSILGLLDQLVQRVKSNDLWHASFHHRLSCVRNSVDEQMHLQLYR